MAVERTTQELTGADVRVERNRYTPIVTQAELASEVRWYHGTIAKIENGEMKLDQNEYRRLIEVVQRLAAQKKTRNQA